MGVDSLILKPLKDPISIESRLAEELCLLAVWGIFLRKQ